ncbi:MgtC/SapB family protein [Dongia sp.]|uniref:MgtC/SapB family protein n=1 Tax=Dongia sp. TaxID=1977262 RepID=UPI0035AEB95A
MDPSNSQVAGAVPIGGASTVFNFSTLDLHLATELLVALAIGLLIGLEREWRKQDGEGADRIGIRTFGLMGLLGGLAGSLQNLAGQWLVPATLLAIAVLMVNDRRRAGDHAPAVLAEDMTTLVAALVTMLLGVLAATGALQLAVACAVIVLALLYLKASLHALIGKLTPAELKATVRFLVISLVVLPVLPDEGYGPYDVLNPRTMWLFVVLISAMSFTGYFAIRALGAALGVLATGFFGGLVSSTATTISFARMASEAPAHGRIFAAGTILANSIMALRVLILAAILTPNLMLVLLWPLGLAGLLAGLVVVFIWYNTRHSPMLKDAVTLSNPFELVAAIKFAVLLTVILLLERFLSERFGEAGLYILSLIAGLADVDAITLSVAKHARAGGEMLTGAAVAILLAVASNAFVKGVIAVRAGGSFARWSAGTMAAMVAVAGIAAFVQYYS